MEFCCAKLRAWIYGGFPSPAGVSNRVAVLRMEFCCAKLRRYAWFIVGYNPPEFALSANSGWRLAGFG
jgi:hypothetical protein